MRPTHAIQYVEVAKDSDEARSMLAWLATQSDYLGGRVIEPSPAKPSWRVQTFHDATGIDARSWLPDGCRFVFMPSSLWPSIAP